MLEHLVSCRAIIECRGDQFVVADMSEIAEMEKCASREVRTRGLDACFEVESGV